MRNWRTSGIEKFSPECVCVYNNVYVCVCGCGWVCVKTFFFGGGGNKESSDFGQEEEVLGANLDIIYNTFCGGIDNTCLYLSEFGQE